MAFNLNRIQWPKITAAQTAFSFNLGNLRTRLDEVYDWLRKSNGAGAKAAVGAHLDAFAKHAKLPSAVVQNTQELTGVAPTGVYATKVTFTVTNGAITGIVLS